MTLVVQKKDFAGRTGMSERAYPGYLTVGVIR